MGAQDYDKAIATYQSILQQEPQASQMMAELAQAVFLKANNRAVPIVGMMAERALAIDSNNTMALGLMGVFNFQNERYAEAVSYWRQAVKNYPPNSPNATALQQGIAQAQSKLGSSSANVESETQPTQTDTGTAARLKVAVSIAAGVPVKPADTVFIYARAWQGAKIPLAITRITAAQLPLTIELNDSMAMTQGMNLSSAEQVELIARLSPSGNAIPQAGDWEVSLGPVKPRPQSPTVYPLVISKPVRVD